MNESAEQIGGGDPVEPVISVVLPLRRFGLLEQVQLVGLFGQDMPLAWELIVVTASEKPQIERFVAGRSIDIRVVASPILNRSAQRNHGVSLARSRNVAFCDGDDLVSKEWVREMWKASDGGSITIGRIERRSLNAPRSLLLRALVAAYDARYHRAFRDYGSSANLCVPRAAIIAIGGFDPRLSAGEDKDLCWRLMAHGLKMVHARRAIVHYRYRQTLFENTLQLFRYGMEAPQLYKMYRSQGMSRLTFAEFVTMWLGILVGPARCHTVQQSCVWFVRAAYRSGRLVGSLRYWTWYP